MRIGMVLPTQFPPDIRVEKEIGTLQQEHEVLLLCPKVGNQPGVENWNGAKVHRVFSRFERGWSRWNLMRACYSTGWHRAIEKFVTECKPQVLHIHDLPLVGAGLKVAQRHAIPLVADLHENYPAMLEQGNRQPISDITSLGKLASRVFVSIPRWITYEQEVVRQANEVFVVIEEARDRLIGIGIDSDRIHVVGNYASQREMQQPTKASEHNTSEKQIFRILYAGGFDPTRDLRCVIAAVSKLRKSDYPNLELQLVGGKGRNLEQLRHYAESLNVADRVNLSAWVPIAKVEEMILNADIGLVPHVKSSHTDTTIPHKLFQYMWQRLPVIVSNCAPLERIVNDTDCGLVYGSGDANALADCIMKLYDEPDRAAAMGAAGHQAVKSRFNWDATGRTLLDVYRKIESAC